MGRTIDSTPDTGSRRDRVRTRRRIMLGACLLLFVLILALAPAAHAHLSIVRQGADGAGLLEAGDRTGSALAFGDFNDDGLQDLVMGAPHETEGALADAGCVVVNYGSAFGPTHRGALLITAAIAGGTAQAAAQFGAGLAAGDFNNDGYDDLAVGAPGENVGPQAGAGRVYVFVGGPTGLGSVATQIFAQGAVGVVAEAGDHFGQTLLADDFNSATPAEDLVVGATGEDSGAGAVSVFPGSLSGLNLMAALSFKQSSFGVTAAPGDRFGAALAAGQLTGSTSSNRDLVVGTPGRDVGSHANAGRIYLIAGDVGGLGSTAVSYDPIVAGGGPEDNGEFGAALAYGQFSSSTMGWVAVGEPGRTASGFSNAGRVVVIPGTAGGLDLGSSLPFQQSGLLPLTDARFGQALAAGKWDDNVYDDLAVGAPTGSFLSPAASDAGRCFVLHGSGTGPTEAGAETFDESTADNGIQSGAEFGTALAFGRCDPGHRASLAVGAPLQDEDPDETDANGPLADAGAVYVIAPWRQPASAAHRSFVVINCEDSLVITRRPFDRTSPSGAARIMTGLLAAESGMLSTSYVIPTWVEDDLPGSLVKSESMTLMALLTKCIVGGASDAAFAIADLLGGGDLCAFVGSMNARATALGMSGTHFSNPAGPPDFPGSCGAMYTTAEDIARLANAAMDDATLSTLTGLTRTVIVRLTPTPVFEAVYDHWMTDLQSVIETASGVHRGFGASSGCSDVGSATVDGDRVIAAGFLAENNQPETAGDMLRLAFEACAAPPSNVGYHDPNSIGWIGAAGETVSVYNENPSAAMRLASVPGEGRRALSILRAVRTGPDTTTFRARRLSGADTARVVLSTAQVLEGLMAPLDSTEIAVRPSRIASWSTRTIRLQNLGVTSASLRLARSGRPDTTFQIAALGSIRLPAASLTNGSIRCVLVNEGPSPSRIIWEDLGHSWSFRLGAAASDTGHFEVAQIVRGALRRGETHLEARVTGFEGDSVEFGVYGPATIPVLSAGAAPAPSGSPLRIIGVSPNPTTGPCRVQFEHRGAGPVEVALFDAAGRRWRSWSIDPSAFAVHEVRWDGTDKAGTFAPPGVYFWRLRAVASGRATTVRFARLR